MKKTVLRALAWVSILPVFISCNIYSPLSTVSGDEDYREQALSCLQQGNYSCALSNYGKLSDPTEKAQDMCTVNLSEAGMSLAALVNIVTSKNTGSKLLGALAQQVVPWSAGNGAAAAQAVTLCSSIPAETSSGNLTTLLQVLSLVLDCSTRMAKTDQFVGLSDSDTNCTTPGNQNGLIEATDISAASDGVPSGSGSPAMCTSDVQACISDIATAIGLLNVLQNAGLGDLANNLQPAAAIVSATPDQARVILRGFTIH
jgi:hypothetical protein